VPPTPPAAVFVFGQAGCGHCTEYIPRFQRLARAYQKAFPIGIYDLAKDKHAVEFADRLGGIRVTPTTVVMSHRGSLHKHPGALTDAQVRAILEGR
jgi:thioredoxin-like negative regulator of GroEL